jgi:Tannase and feruloyl esterase
MGFCDASDQRRSPVTNAGYRSRALACLGYVNCASAQTFAIAPVVSVQDAPSACTALATATIPAPAIGERSGRGVVTSATYKLAVADAPRPAAPTAGPNAQPAGFSGPAIIRGTPDFWLVLIDIKPVDANAPLIKVQVNLPTQWNGKTLQFGGGGYNGTLQTGVSPSRNAGRMCRCR